MAAESGGIASKLGSIFERRYAVELLLHLFLGRIRRLRWEPASGLRGGADIEIEPADGPTVEIQLKRQNGSAGRWTVADLDHEGVLAAIVAAETKGHHFRFVSSDPVLLVRDISDQLLRSSEPPDQFVETHIASNKERKKAFDDLVRRWGLAAGLSDSERAASVRTALERLRRTRFDVVDIGEGGRGRLLLSIELAFTGDPGVVLGLLESFLEDRLSRDVFADEVLAHIEAQGVRPRALERDATLPAAMAAIRERFQDALRSQLIEGAWLHRREATEIAAAIQQPDAPRVVILHGRAGQGKSGVLFGLMEELVRAGVPLLPVSLAAQPLGASLRDYGESLGLGASPAPALAALAAGRRAVLALDQLDAIRITSPASEAAWATCRQLMDGALGEPNITVVVACRSFDLEHDPIIRQWSESLQRAGSTTLRVPVGDLDDEQVARTALRVAGVEYASLPPRLQQLLRHPSTLSAWCRLAALGTVHQEYTTQARLLSDLIDELRRRAAVFPGVNGSDVNAIVDSCRENMSETGRQVVHGSRLPDLPLALDACCSVGLLVRKGAQVSFPHQSYLDFLVASHALRHAGGDVAALMGWLARDQSLGRRDQVRQVVLLLRDSDPATARGFTEALLISDAVRFHIKQLTLGLLHELPGVDKADVAVARRLAALPGWADHLRQRVLWGSVAWFDALSESGAWREWLAAAAGDERDKWLRVACSVIGSRPRETDELLTTVLPENRLSGRQALQGIANFDPIDDSPWVARVREDAVRRGAWHVYQGFLDRVAKRDPERAARLVVAVIRGALVRFYGARADREDDLREGLLDKEAGRALRLHGQGLYKPLSRLLIASERLDSRRGKRSVNAGGPYLRRRGDVHGLLVRAVGEALLGVADEAPARFREILSSSLGQPERLDIATAHCLGQAPLAMADAALDWLCADFRRLRLRESPHFRRHALALGIIERHAADASADCRERLEAGLLSYFPCEEVSRYRFQLEQTPLRGQGHPVGHGQFLLLRALPLPISDVIQRRIGLWSAKFADPTERAELSVQGGWVRSPIPEDRTANVSDGQWRGIVSGAWTRQRRQAGPDVVAEASHRTFAVDFGSVAKKAPGRFVSLALTFPAGTAGDYFETLWWALSDSVTPLGECHSKALDTLLMRAVEEGNAAVLRAACAAVRQHPEAFGNETVWLLIERASAHPEPEPGLYTVLSGTDRAADLEATALNCMRGAAAYTLGSFVWTRRSECARALPVVRRLAVDPHPSVRIAAAAATLSVLATEADAGAEILGQICGHENEGVLASSQVNELIQRVRWSHPDAVYPILDKMVHSEHEGAQTAGARWATAERFQRGVLGALYHPCLAGSIAHRMGVAEVLSQLVPDDRVHDAATLERDLITLFSDADEGVRAAAAGPIVRDEGWLSSEVGARIAIAFVASGAFIEHCSTFLHTLIEGSPALIPLASAVLAASDRLAGEFSAETRGLHHRAGLVGRDASLLLLRLYDQALKGAEPGLAEACLDRWDSLLRNGVGDAERHLEAFEA